MTDSAVDISATPVSSVKDRLKARLESYKRRQRLGDADQDSTSDKISHQPSSNFKPLENQEFIKDVSLKDLEKHILTILGYSCLDLPCSAFTLMNKVTKAINHNVTEQSVEIFLEQFYKDGLIGIRRKTVPVSERLEMEVISSDPDKIRSRLLVIDVTNKHKTSEEDESHSDSSSLRTVSSSRPPSKVQKTRNDSIETLLTLPTARERESKKNNKEIQNLLMKETAKEKAAIERFKSPEGAVREYCPCMTREECFKTNGPSYKCGKVHYRKIIKPHTDVTLGDCSFLNTCFHMDKNCKYVHYQIENDEKKPSEIQRTKQVVKKDIDPDASYMIPPQWIECDLRQLDLSVLGKCAVLMADPPWDIHMELPYGTMSDDEMRKLPVPVLQDDGFLFLWVTGRAMELGRECLDLWGYKRIEELIWVKTNQLQRLIRTGRTGHWLNHGKEHCLVGVKGEPKNINRGLDCDIIVSEVRATSHKPDEIYGIIERLSPGTRKVELFGRPHNVQPNWITLGNQLNGVQLLEPDIVSRFKERYPSGKIEAPKPKS